ncbi:MAG: C40 family peptidase [Oscillospiraceae bacterium]|nr:C40 family peptidase [Oscillospiraceae bacterium]
MNTVFLNSVTDIFSKPDGTERIDQALSGTTARVLQQSNGWFNVETCYGYCGWVQKSRLRQVARQTTWDSSPKMVVQQSSADVLTHTHVQSTCLTTLVRGCIVGLLSKEVTSGWLHICLPNGEAGWLPECFLKPFPSFEGIAEMEMRRRILQAAISYLGTQYRWGGKSPFGIDCSGLTQMAYTLSGINIWRDAVIQPGYPIHEIPKEDLQPADLLFFAGHVAIYLGNHKYIHSTGHVGSNCVTINSLDSKSAVYREDLADGLTAVGSAFPLKKEDAFSII